jgi:hypothetical protein
MQISKTGNKSKAMWGLIEEERGNHKKKPGTLN